MSLLQPPRRPLLMPAWARNSLWRQAAAVPSLDLNFAVTKNVGPLVSFTRASTATYIDSAGTLQTAAVDVPRFDHNPTTGESLGLLVEDQRTNLLLNTATLSTQSVTVTAVAHTLSFYGSGTVTLSGASTAGPAVGSGAFPARTTLTFTPSAGTLTLTVTGSVTSAQLEAGAFATSYIPTTTAAATRNADVANITGTNFSSWYRQGTGSIFMKYILQNTTAAYSARFDNGSVSNSVQFIANANNANINISSVAQYSRTSIPFVVNQIRVQCLAYELDNVNSVFDGILGVNDSLATIPTVDQLVFVGHVGPIARLTYWPTRLPDSTLQAITQ
jgi:hypothetical protein